MQFTDETMTAHEEDTLAAGYWQPKMAKPWRKARARADLLLTRWVQAKQRRRLIQKPTFKQAPLLDQAALNARN
ncbi:hypothetical protein W822_13775 [Advenella kashmirensis W13003]|uniref:Uncharacterized protein n=1 Tax=Advenella kashmirensis W13003 TaxID=1424334 RepID=V8QQW5_9BURK|nr:hypothetical protein W822_13775 [Advenella kashmirensis W13003]